MQPGVKDPAAESQEGGGVRTQRRLRGRGAVLSRGPNLSGGAVGRGGGGGGGTDDPRAGPRSAETLADFGASPRALHGL